MSAIAQAADRARQATKDALVAELASTRAWAEVARLELLEFAEESPTVIGLSFESEYEYDDEGGYFLSTSVYPLVNEGLADPEWDPYEFSDKFQGYGHNALAMLCAVDPDAREGQVTLAEAQSRNFS
jgi:hypothetical protein